MSDELKRLKKTTGRNRKVGFVVSKSGDKSIVIKVDRLMRHSKFHRVVKRSKRYMVHDENNICKVGDKVEIIESRPLSRMKKWSLVKVVEAGK